MRQARSFVGGKFAPKSVEEFVAAIKKGGEEAGYLLQVYGYWDMVCAFVKHGFLSATLVYDTCQEMYFQYAKIQPYLSGFRKEMGPCALRLLSPSQIGGHASQQFVLRGRYIQYQVVGDGHL